MYLDMQRLLFFLPQEQKLNMIFIDFWNFMNFMKVVSQFLPSKLYKQINDV